MAPLIKSFQKPLQKQIKALTQLLQDRFKAFQGPNSPRRPKKHKRLYKKNSKIEGVFIFYNYIKNLFKKSIAIALFFSLFYMNICSMELGGVKKRN